MSLLNLTSDGLPNVLVVLCEALKRRGVGKPVARSELLSEVAPEQLVASQDMVRNTLNTWTQLGVFLRSDDGKDVSLSKEYAAIWSKRCDWIAVVRDVAREAILVDRNNEELWGEGDSAAADLTRSLAWLLSQDVYRLASHLELEALERSQLIKGTPPLMQNSTRVTGLRYWGSFLGFIRQVSGGFDVDPTVVIKGCLSECIAEGEDMPAADFIDQLADVLPVIDRGRYRVAVEGKLDAPHLRSMVEGQLSPALSRALLNLRAEKVLILENRSDVGKGIVLTGRDGPRQDHRYTWLRRSREAVR